MKRAKELLRFSTVSGTGLVTPLPESADPAIYSAAPATDLVFLEVERNETGQRGKWGNADDAVTTEADESSHAHRAGGLAVRYQ